MLMFDTEKFLANHFDTPGNLIARYRSVNATIPSISAVEKWFQRGRIPGSHLAVLFYIVEQDTGRGLSIGNYMTRVGE